MGEKKKPEGVGHKALYRKYRSKSLDEIVGQEHITKTLKNAINSGKISHAYLFTGPRGTGKTSIARIVAHEINKLPYTDESSHLDIIEIDAASNRRIDDIRELRDKIHIAPAVAQYKVYIIDEVHMLTPESFNALLKTLEEPPKHVIFILATTEAHKLPATIISRTQRHSFRLIPFKQIVQHLRHISDKEGIQIDDSALQLLAEHGGGSFRDSISLLDQIHDHKQKITAQVVEELLGIAPKVLLNKLLRYITSGDTKGVLQILEELNVNGLAPSSIAEQLYKLLREDIQSADNTSFVNMMGDLLEVHNAQYQQLKLEMILLKAAAQNTASTQKETGTTATQQTPVTRPTIIAPVKQAKAVIKNNEEESPAITDTTDEIPQAAQSKRDSKKRAGMAIDIQNEWPALLHIIKQKNNSLYTILKLAHVSITSEELQLGFQYSFHQKKVDEVKNKALIAEAIQLHLDLSVEVISVLDKSLTPNFNGSSAAPLDDAHASLISNVQDIMGGGEIVHV